MNNAQTEVRQPVPKAVEVGHVLAGAGIKSVDKQFKEDAAKWQVIINQKSTSESMGKRALENIKREIAHSYDGRDIEDSLNQIKDASAQDKAKGQVLKARTQMAAIDIFRFKDPAEQLARYQQLAIEGKIPAGVVDLPDLKKQAVQQIVAEKWFQDYTSESKFSPKDLAAVAEKLFLSGSTDEGRPTADALQNYHSEQVALLQEQIQKLPTVAKTVVENTTQTKAQTEAVMLGVEKSIHQAVVDLSGSPKGSTLNQSSEAKIKAALEITDEGKRKAELTKAVAEIQGVTPAGFKAIEEIAADKVALTELRERHGQANNTSKNKNVSTKGQIDLKIKNLEAKIAASEKKNAGELLKYQKANNFVEGDGEKLAKIYQDNKNSYLLANLIELGASGAPQGELPKDAQDRALAEQKLIGFIDVMSSEALSKAVLERTNVLKEAAVIEATHALETADDVQAKILTTYIDNLTHGEGTFIEDKLIDKTNPKLGIKTVVHIKNLEQALGVIARDDTDLGGYGTKFLMAYKAGLFDKTIDMKDPNGGTTSVKADKVAEMVLQGQLSSIKALSLLDSDSKNNLDTFATTEQTAGFTKHLFAEFTRAKKYIAIGGKLGKGRIFGVESENSKAFGKFWRKLQGYDVEIDGDASKLDIMKAHWDKIIETHSTEIQTAINNSDTARDMMNTLEQNGWVSGDKRKGWLYALMMVLGMIAVPIGGASILGVGTISSLGGAAGLTAAGAFAGSKVAGGVTRNLPN